MNLIITLEALKFYKIKAEKLVQILFVVLVILNAGIWFLPFCDYDFNAVYTAMEEMAAGRMAAFELTQGNWIFLGLMLLTQLINLLTVFFYAALFASEKMPSVEITPLQMTVHALPRLLLLFALMIVPAMMSMLLLMIPVIVFAFMMYFMPINLFLHKQNIAYAMNKSFEQTKGFRLIIFFQVFFLSMLLTFPETILINMLSGNLIATVLIQSFFAVFLSFSQGRLMGIYYLYLVKKDPLVVPSITNDDKEGK